MKQSFDYIVVGGGTAGCVLATRLSQKAGISVLLIEAGPAKQPLISKVPLMFMPLKQHPQACWPYVSEVEPHAGNRRFPRPHGRGLGGSSAINGMIAVRGMPEDYDDWTAAGLKGWSYQDVLPYFKKAESNWRGASALHGDQGPWRIGKGNLHEPFFKVLAKAAAETGRPMQEDFAAGPQEGIGAPDFSIHRGQRVSTATAYLALAGKGLVILSDAQVNRVTLDGKRATGVEVTHHGHFKHFRAAREVILSAGGYNSPKILMLSGIGDAEELQSHGITVRHHLPGVGRNLQNHPSVPLRYHATYRDGFNRELRLDRVIASGVSWALFKSGNLARVPLTALGYVRSREGLERCDVQIMYSTGRMDDRIWVPKLRPALGQFVSTSLSLCRPLSRGRLRLSSADPAAMPSILFNMLQDPDDIRRLRDALRRERRFFEAAAFKGILAEEDLPGRACQSDDELDAKLRATVTSAQHPTSSCAMGVGTDAVLDARLCVYGIAGLRVADASAFPMMTSGNPYATVVMLAEKAADLVLEQHDQARAA